MSHWIDICSIDDLQADSGVCALVEKTQVAIFYLPKKEAIYAINNYDPFGKVHVLSRGLLGDIQGEPMICSPLYKQHYNLLTGACYEDESITLATYAIRITNNRVEVSLEG